MLPHGYEQPAAIALAAWRRPRLLRRLPALPDRSRHLRLHPGRDDREFGRWCQQHHAACSSRLSSGVSSVRWCSSSPGSSACRSSAPGIGVLVAHIVWSQVARAIRRRWRSSPCAVAGAIGAMFVQKYVIVAGTAFGGAWTIVLAAVNCGAARAGLGRGASDTEVWIFYPTSAPASRWVPVAWIALGLVGTAVQLRRRREKKRKPLG